MKLCLATFTGFSFACGSGSAPPVDTPASLPPAEPPADLSREPTKAVDAGKEEQQLEQPPREPSQQ